MFRWMKAGLAPLGRNSARYRFGICIAEPGRMDLSGAATQGFGASYASLAATDTSPVST
jgi:hypothetical protein